ncbi:MAG: ABC transporter substrate-binding protein [Chlamydiae bacterium]|nr:ABC transporter substrate-binding protein [Chlamydiota bacterium]
MSKRFVYFCIVVLLASCSTVVKKQEAAGLGKIQVLATTAMIADLVAEVGGDRVFCDVLIRGEADPHSYELVKGDGERMDAASVLFFTGLNLEHGASLRAKILTHAHSVSLGGYIAEHYADLLLWEEGQVDPHVWMDISLWAKVITPIVEALVEMDPQGTSYYQERGELLYQHMMEHHEKLCLRMRAIPEHRRYLVTSHDAFGYFTRGYLASEEELATEEWKVRCKAPEGLSPDGQLGALHLQRIVDHLVQYQISTVFPESNVSQDSLKKIVAACKEKKKPIRFSSCTLYGDCMGEPGSLGESYLGMIEHNVGVLIQEWQ